MEREPAFLNTCPMCQADNVLLATAEESDKIDEYIEGNGLVQNVLSFLNPLEREFIKTGYCPACQKKLFQTNFTTDRLLPLSEIIAKEGDY